MGKKLKIIAASVMALMCASAHGMMIQPQPNLLITVRHHQPRGITPHYFSLAPTSTHGDLQQAIANKLRIDTSFLRLTMSKFYVESDSLADQSSRVEVMQLLDDPERPLSCDKTFGVPKVKEYVRNEVVTSYQHGFFPPSYDLVCIPDLARSPDLFSKFKKVLDEKIVINSILIADLHEQADTLTALHKLQKTYNNDFKDF